MVQFRPKARELIAKVVYYGPPLGGKTTNLRSVFAGYPKDTRGELIVVPTGSDRTIFFDFLPIDLGMLRGMRVRVQLYTVPGQVRYNATRQVVLRGVDGVVFVADSQRALMRNNKESWENLKDNLILQGLKLSELAHVVQYNKRDLKDIASIEELDELLNEYNAPFYEAVASTGIGVEETLQGMVKLVIRSLRERFQLDGEQALTQPVHMGLRDAQEAAPEPPGEAAPSIPGEQSGLPPAEEVPSTGVPEVTLVRNPPGEQDGAIDPFRTQRISTSLGVSDGTESPAAAQDDESVSGRAIFEEATHPDLEAQVARMQMEREQEQEEERFTTHDGEAVASPDRETPPQAEVVQLVDGAPAESEGEETASPVVPEPPVTAMPGPPAAGDPFAVTGSDIPPPGEHELPPPPAKPVEEVAATDQRAWPEQPSAPSEAQPPGPTPFEEPSGQAAPEPESPIEPVPPTSFEEAGAAPPPTAEDSAPVTIHDEPAPPAAAFQTEPEADEPVTAPPTESTTVAAAGDLAQPPAAAPPDTETAVADDAAPPVVEAGEEAAPPAWDEPPVQAVVEDFVFGSEEATPPPSDTAVGDLLEETPFAAQDSGDAVQELGLDGESVGAEPAYVPGPDELAPPTGFEAAETEREAEPEPFAQEPPSAFEAEASPEQPTSEPEIGLGAAVAAVRAHGEEGARDVVSDEVEALAAEPELDEAAAPAAEPEEAFGVRIAGPAATVDVPADVPVLGAEEPFSAPAAPMAPASEDPFAAGAAPPADAVDDVFAITPAPPHQAVPAPETIVVPVEISAVRRAAGRALAQVGEVRELELAVPVPGDWTGGRRMTLQLRLTLVPQEEDHER